MNFNIFLAQALTNSLLTAAIVAGIILVLFIEKKLLKNEDHINRWFVAIVYFFTFVALIASILGIFSIWGYDLAGYIETTLDNLALGLSENLGRIISSTVIIVIAFFVMKFSKIAFKRIGLKEGRAQRRRKTVGKLLSSVTRYTVGIIAIISVLSVWGFNVGPALAGLGIMGLVIGLGAQKFINDLIAGFFIIFEQHYDVEDVVEAQGFKGVVTDIGLKTTKIRNWKGDVKILANGDMTNITNYSRNLSVAIVEFGVAYKENIGKVLELLTENLPKFKALNPVIIEEPVVSGVIALNSSSVDIRVIAKTLNEQHYAVERSLRKFIKDLLDENGIEIPFPQVVVHQPKA
ncbi:MAG: mechanosensitive ion channel family protein [Acholeplasmataceae bacterium]|nr:mechanosensitive ion channel family protein [Acholeplasmataceae bacterium]